MSDKAPSVFEDVLTTGNSPVTLNVFETQGHAITGLTIVNTGRASFTAQESVSGQSFGDAITIEPGDKYKVTAPTAERESGKIDQVLLTRGTADSSFKVMASAGFVDFSKDSRIRVDSVSVSSIVLNATTATLILAANPDRLEFIVSNANSQDVWIKEQAAAVDNLKEGVILFKRSVVPFDDDNIYTGEVSAIAVVGSPTIVVREK